MQIRTIRKGFECKFEPFERDLNHSKSNSNHSKQIRSILIPFEVFEYEFEPFDGCKHSNSNSKHRMQIRSIRMHIPTIQKEFEVFESKF